MKISELAELQVGSPQFRIQQAFTKQAPSYTFYSQSDLEADLVDLDTQKGEVVQIKTNEKVETLETGMVVFNLISGMAAIVRKRHNGYLYTQNYVTFKLDSKLNPKFLVYLLNESRYIAHQLHIGLQGTSVLKYSVKQLRELKLPSLPPIDKQELLGDIYFKQKRLQALQERKAKNLTQERLAQIEEALGWNK